MNYNKSVANQIYSFPLELNYCISIMSSDQSSLDDIEEYDLHMQNKKYSDLDK